MPSKKRKNRKVVNNPFSDYPQPQLESELVNNPFSDYPQPQLESELLPKASAPPQPLPPKPQEQSMHKNRLQEYTQRSSIPLPVYKTINEGSQHAPRFRSTVEVDGICYNSENTFSHRKTAEQDVAKYALECISKKLKDEGCPLIREDTVFCKSILNEFAVKLSLEMPTYNSIQSEGLIPLFTSSVVFNGVQYNGGTGRNKKEAEQLAARAAITSLLEDPTNGTTLEGIIKSKTKLYAALNMVKDSSVLSFGNTPTGANTLILNNKEVETAVVKNNVPTSAIVQPTSELDHPLHEFKIPKSEVETECSLPIAFVPPVGQASDVGGDSSRKRHREEEKG